MKQDIAVAIPIYKQVPGKEELNNLHRAYSVLSHRDIFLIHPEGLDISEYVKAFPKIRPQAFQSRYFKGIEGYNKLMLNLDFYQYFSSYDYILILQADVLIFNDELDYWTSKDYDYVGAPWHERKPHFIQYCIAKTGLKHLFRLLSQPELNAAVGNGGFSLRKTRTFIDICQHDKKIRTWKGNEDYFWSLIARKSDGKPLSKPADKEAAKFCIETSPEYYRNFLTSAPMALHAYAKHGKDFWKKTIEEKLPGFLNEN